MRSTQNWPEILTKHYQIHLAANKYPSLQKVLHLALPLAELQ